MRYLCNLGGGLACFLANWKCVRKHLPSPGTSTKPNNGAEWAWKATLLAKNALGYNFNTRNIYYNYKLLWQRKQELLKIKIKLHNFLDGNDLIIRQTLNQCLCYAYNFRKQKIFMSVTFVPPPSVNSLGLGRQSSLQSLQGSKET